MKTTVAVIFGGKSVEHEISIISAMQGINALDTDKYDVLPVYISKNGDFYTGEKLRYMETFKNIDRALAEAVRVMPVRDESGGLLIKYPPSKLKNNTVAHFDVIIPITHGTNVEDGALQGFLEYIGAPYAGADVCASAVGMDKWVCKSLLKAEALPVVPGVLKSRTDYYTDSEKTVSEIEGTLEYPIIVKPVNLGSSVGISRAKDREELISALENAFTFSPRTLCERAVPNLREINCSVIGDIDGTRASVCEEPLNATDILSFDDKYQSGGSSKGMSSTKRKLPADITPEQSAYIQALAQAAFKAVNLSGVCRIDFLMDGQTGEIWINELNTIPGSLSFYLWEASGMNFTELMDKLVELALKKHREKSATVYTFNSNVLSGQGGSKGKK